MDDALLGAHLIIIISINEAAELNSQINRGEGRSSFARGNRWKVTIKNSRWIKFVQSRGIGRKQKPTHLCVIGIVAAIIVKDFNVDKWSLTRRTRSFRISQRAIKSLHQIMFGQRTSWQATTLYLVNDKVSASQLRQSIQIIGWIERNPVRLVAGIVAVVESLMKMLISHLIKALKTAQISFSIEERVGLKIFSIQLTIGTVLGCSKRHQHWFGQTIGTIFSPVSVFIGIQIVRSLKLWRIQIQNTVQINIDFDCCCHCANLTSCTSFALYKSIN